MTRKPTKKKTTKKRAKRKKTTAPRHNFGKLKLPRDAKIKDGGMVVGDDEDWGDDDGFDETCLTERAKDGDSDRN